MHLYQTHHGKTARELAALPQPAGPGMFRDVVRHTERLEVWASRFAGPGYYYYLFVAYDASGRRICQKKVTAF